MSKRDWTAEDLARQAEAAAALVEFLKAVDEDDADLVQDTIEGETDFLETMGRALEQVAEAEMMADALKRRIAGLTDRKRRFETRAQTLRDCVALAMAAANGPEEDRPLPFTLTTPAATVTLREGKPKVVVSDEARLPAEFWRTPDPVVDKAKLNEYVANWRAYWAGDVGGVIEGDEGAFPEKLPDGVELTDPGYTLILRRN